MLTCPCGSTHILKVPLRQWAWCWGCCSYLHVEEDVLYHPTPASASDGATIVLDEQGAPYV